MQLRTGRIGDRLLGAEEQPNGIKPSVSENQRSAFLSWEMVMRSGCTVRREQTGWGVRTAPGDALKAEPPGFLLGYLHVGPRAELIEPFQRPRVHINQRL